MVVVVLLHLSVAQTQSSQVPTALRTHSVPGKIVVRAARPLSCVIRGFSWSPHSVLPLFLPSDALQGSYFWHTRRYYIIDCPLTCLKLYTGFMIGQTASERPVVN